MKTEQNILAAFALNLFFSVFEFFGGIFTGSTAISSDAIHDMGDALSIGISYFLERKSKRRADERYTFGYARYSVIGGLITSLILTVGSIVMIYNAIGRIITPRDIHYDGMIIFAVAGVAINTVAAFITHKGDSLNQKAVSLHMLEDVLGWVVVLIGAIVMKFTGFSLIDPIMSIAVSLFILISAVKNTLQVLDVLLEKAPLEVKTEELREHIAEIEGISDVHHIHLWSMDGYHNYATMHIVTEMDHPAAKEAVRAKALELGVGHVTIEIDSTDEDCQEEHCPAIDEHEHVHHHHHH